MIFSWEDSTEFLKATKGLRWMPWHQEAMKAADNCDKPRRVVTDIDPGIAEWGNPPIY